MSKLKLIIKKISLSVFLAGFVALSFVSSVSAADVRVAGTVVSGIDSKAIQNAGVTITNAADAGPSQFFPKSTLTGGQGGFSFDILESEFAGGNTLRVLLTARSPVPQTATANATFTVQKTGANNIPIIKLDIAGNTNYTPQPGGATNQSSGTIQYISPDLSPIFKGRTYETLGDYLADLVQVAMVLSVVGATLVVVYAGFGYLNSGGSPEATAKSKEMIAGALLGIATVFLMSAFLVSLYDKETLNNLAPPADQSGSSSPLTAAQRTALITQTKEETKSTLARALETTSISIAELKNYDCTKLFRTVSGNAKQKAIDEAYNQGVISGCTEFKKSKVP